MYVCVVPKLKKYNGTKWQGIEHLIIYNNSVAILLISCPNKKSNTLLFGDTAKL